MKPYLRDRTGHIHQAMLRPLGEGDLDETLALQSSACSRAVESYQYLPATGEDFSRLLERGWLLGLYASGSLCGVCGVEPPQPGRALGAELGMCEEDCAISAELKYCFVDPAFSGNSAAAEIACVGLRRAVSELGARYVLTHFSPKNYAALCSALSLCDMRVAALAQLEGCRLRYIARYDHLDSRAFTHFERFAADDLYGIGRSLADRCEIMAFRREPHGLYLWLAG